MFLKDIVSVMCGGLKINSGGVSTPTFVSASMGVCRAGKLSSVSNEDIDTGYSAILRPMEMMSCQG